MNNTMIEGFFNELEAIEKQAGMGTLIKPLSTGLKSTFKGFGRGAQNVGRAISGTATNKAGKQLALSGPKRWHLARAGAKQMLPGAAVGATGGLAAYGVGKAVSGS